MCLFIGIGVYVRRTNALLICFLCIRILRSTTYITIRYIDVCGFLFVCGCCRYPNEVQGRATGRHASPPKQDTRQQLTAVAGCWTNHLLIPNAVYIVDTPIAFASAQVIGQRFSSNTASYYRTKRHYNSTADFCTSASSALQQCP